MYRRYRARRRMDPLRPLGSTAAVHRRLVLHELREKTKGTSSKWFAFSIPFSSGSPVKVRGADYTVPAESVQRQFGPRRRRKFSKMSNRGRTDLFLGNAVS